MWGRTRTRTRTVAAGEPRPFLGRLGEALRRRAVLLVVVAVVLAATAVGLAALRTDTTPASFLPANDPDVAALDAAARSFGGDPIVVLVESAKPRELFGGDAVEKLVGMEGKLSSLPDVAVVYGPGSVINQIAGSAQNLLATLSGKRDAIRTAAEDAARAAGAPPEAVGAAGTQSVAEFDLRYGALLVQALPAGLPTVHNPAFVDKVVFDAQGAPTDQMRFVVPSANAAAVLIRPRQDLDQAGTERLVERARATVEAAGLPTTRVTVTGTPAVAAELGTTVQQEIPILGGLAVGLIAACYAFSPWTRRRRHRLLPLAATLAATAVVLGAFGWLGRPLSLGVVAFLPILIGIGSDFPAYVVHGVRRRVVVVTALASAAGFASLGLSPLPFVRDLGLALAAGVLVALAIALLGARYLVADGDPGGEDAVDGAARAVPAPRTADEPAGPPTPRHSLAVRLGALAAAAAIAVTGWVALPGLGVTARPDELAAGLPAVLDAQHAEEVLGSSGEVQILLEGASVGTPEALAWMRGVGDTTVLRFGGRLHPIVSPPELLRFLGDTPTQQEIDSALELIPPYLVGSVLRSDRRAAVLSYGIELQDIKDQTALLDTLRASLPPPPPGMRASVVGLPVAAARGFDLVSADRYLTNLGGIVAAGLVLLIGLRRRTDALRAITAAALATGWGLAAIWLLGLPLSPLTVGLGSLTTVTACEFTMMSGQGGGRRGLQAWRTVAVAAGAAALGYLALAASALAVIAEFGLLLAMSVGLSFLAAHLVWRLSPRGRSTDEPAHDAGAARGVDDPTGRGAKEVAR